MLQQNPVISIAGFVARTSLYPFSEEIIVDETGAVDPNIQVMKKVSSLFEVVCVGGRYELMYQLWALFTMFAVRVNVDVTWSRDEVFVSIYICPVFPPNPCAYSLLPILVHHPEWDVSSDSVSLHQLGKVTREL